MSFYRSVMQLPRVNGRYIFEEQAWPDYKKSHVWQSLWDLFSPLKCRKKLRAKKTSNSSYHKITLIDKKKIRKELQKLHPDQRYLVDVLIRFARFLKLAKKGRCRFPTPPLMVVKSDARSGKYEVIRILCQAMEHEFREARDDPDKLYILKSKFTGEVTTNIKAKPCILYFTLILETDCLCYPIK